MGIVKNEAWNFKKTLESAKPFIDAWHLLDTGSTDGTQDLIQETLRGVPGELIEAPFVDYSTSRNQVILSARRHRPGYQLLLSGTETLHGGEALRRALHSHQPGYNIEIRREGLVYPLVRLFDPDAGWRFQGRTHEVLVGPQVIAPRIEGCHIHYGGGKDKRPGWERDLELLRLDLTENPADPRSAFYLAQTLECLGRKAEALKAYGYRLSLGGWAEECYVAELRGGRLAQELGHDPAPYWRAASMRIPDRAEALYELANLYHKREQFLEAYLLAKEASRKSLSVDRLFVEHDIYAWKVGDLVATHAYRFGDLADGFTAARIAVEANPQEGRLSDNLAWYRAKMGA